MAFKVPFECFERWSGSTVWLQTTGEWRFHSPRVALCGHLVDTTMDDHDVDYMVVRWWLRYHKQLVLMYKYIAPNINVYNCQKGTTVKQQNMAKQNLILSKGNVHSWRNMNCIFSLNLWAKYSLWMDCIKYSLCVVWWAVQYFSPTTTGLWRVHHAVTPSHWHKQYSVADRFCW